MTWRHGTDAPAVVRRRGVVSAMTSACCMRTRRWGRSSRGWSPTQVRPIKPRGQVQASCHTPFTCPMLEHPAVALSLACPAIACPGFWALFWYRLSHALYTRKVPFVSTFVPRLIMSIVRYCTAVDIHPAAVLSGKIPPPTPLHHSTRQWMESAAVDCYPPSRCSALRRPLLPRSTPLLLTFASCLWWVWQRVGCCWTMRQGW